MGLAVVGYGTHGFISIFVRSCRISSYLFSPMIEDVLSEVLSLSGSLRNMIYSTAKNK